MIFHSAPLYDGDGDNDIDGDGDNLHNLFSILEMGKLSFHSVLPGKVGPSA